MCFGGVSTAAYLIGRIGIVYSEANSTSAWVNESSTFDCQVILNNQIHEIAWPAFNLKICSSIRGCYIAVTKPGQRWSVCCYLFVSVRSISSRILNSHPPDRWRSDLRRLKRVWETHRKNNWSPTDQRQTTFLQQSTAKARTGDD